LAYGRHSIIGNQLLLNLRSFRNIPQRCYDAKQLGFVILEASACYLDSAANPGFG
jgi:hypothetical protein